MNTFRYSYNTYNLVITKTEAMVKEKEALETGIQAYIYAYPLVMMGQTLRVSTNVATPEGTSARPLVLIRGVAFTVCADELVKISSQNSPKGRISMLHKSMVLSAASGDSFSIAPRSVHIAGRGTECRFLYRVTAS